MTRRLFLWAAWCAAACGPVSSPTISPAADAGPLPKPRGKPFAFAGAGPGGGFSAIDNPNAGGELVGL